MSDPHNPETLKDLLALLDDLRGPGSDPTCKMVHIPRYIADSEVARIAKLEADLARADALNAETGATMSAMMDDLARVTAQCEQTTVQLAGCSVAALCGRDQWAKEGDYGWSASFGDVVALREENERLREAQEASDE